MPWPTVVFALDSGLFVVVNNPVFLFRATALCMSASMGKTDNSMASCVLRRLFLVGGGDVMLLLLFLLMSCVAPTHQLMCSCCVDFVSLKCNTLNCLCFGCA